MGLIKFQKQIAILSTFTIVFVTAFGFMAFLPNKAQAQLASSPIGTGAVAAITVPTNTLGDLPRSAESWYISIMRGIAFAVVDKLTNTLINKITEKYRIQNYLYYDQVLSNYYLMQFIQDKITDPDLQTIYNLMNAAYVTGQYTGLNGQPNPNNAAIPKLKKAISDYYLKIGGVPESTVFNPPSNMSDAQYFDAAASYFQNPPSFTAQNLYGDFGAFQSNATTAAQLEVIVGNSLKAGRVIGGTCAFASGASIPTAAASTPTSCAAAGGTWKPSSLDQARSFIQNPTIYINSWLQSFISQRTNTNFDPNNFWYAIGSALGNFLINKLTSSSGDVLNENPTYSYSPGQTVASPGKEIDIDGDGVMDGLDEDNDGTLNSSPDICYWGGIDGTVMPPCKGSLAATTPPPPPTTGGGERPACTVEGYNEQQFLLPLLNAIPPMDPVVSPPPADYQAAVNAAVAQTDQKFGLSPAQQNSGDYKPDNNTIGYPQWYAAGPTPSRPFSPGTNIQWDANPVCPAP